MKIMNDGDHGAAVKSLQNAINRRLVARGASSHKITADGEFGPRTREALRYACSLLGMSGKDLDGIERGGISQEEQLFVLNPGRRTQEEKDEGKRRVAAHKKLTAKLQASAAEASSRRQKIVEEAERAAANYRKNPAAYHYLAGGVANLIYLEPSPLSFRSDCSQFAAAVYKAAGLPSPASVAHEWASTYTMVKAPGVKFVYRADRKPGMLGMYGSRTAPHHVEIWCGDKFIGHGSPPIDSLTPGEPDYYLDFPFLD